MPSGFLGTRGDILMDLVIVAFLLIMPVLLMSWRCARCGDYTRHRALQIGLASVLAVAVVLFEIDLKLSGGIFILTAPSAYSGTTLLNSLIYGHMLVAIGSVLVWAPLLLFSAKHFGNPPQPGVFSERHRFWGRVGMLLMMLSGLSALPLYYLGFAL